jgi:hypothetical protein
MSLITERHVNVTKVCRVRNNHVADITGIQDLEEVIAMNALLHIMDFLTARKSCNVIVYMGNVIRQRASVVAHPIIMESVVSIVWKGIPALPTVQVVLRGSRLVEFCAWEFLWLFLSRKGQRTGKSLVSTMNLLIFVAVRTLATCLPIVTMKKMRGALLCHQRQNYKTCIVTQLCTSSQSNMYGFHSHRQPIRAVLFLAGLL